MQLFNELDEVSFNNQKVHVVVLCSVELRELRVRNLRLGLTYIGA